MVYNAEQWRWRSYRAAGYEECAACLTTEWLLAQFADTKKVAQQRYRDFIQAGQGRSCPWQKLNNQIYLGDDDFVSNMQCMIDSEQSLQDSPKKQKNAPLKALAYFAERYKTRNERMAYAYLSGHYTLTQVGDYFDVSYATVSRAVKQIEKDDGNVKCKA